MAAEGLTAAEHVRPVAAPHVGRRAAASVMRTAAVAVAAGFVWLSALSTGVRAEIIDRVLAVVAGNLITQTDVTAAYELKLVTPAGPGDPMRDVLRQLIDRQLEISEVERYSPIEPSPADIDREVALVQGRFPSRDAFDAVLTRTGINLAHVRETVRENLRIRAYLAERFTVNDGRRQQVIDDWVAGLRRRADVIDLSLQAR